MKALLCTGQLVLALLLVHILSTVTATRIFCQAPPVFVGDPANLTCHFPEDLSQSQKSIAVLRRDSIPGSRLELILGCVWGNGKLRCGVRDWYWIITKQPTYDVTFQIPSHKPGTFRCDYVPSDKAVTVQSCNFTLKATRIFCRVPPIPEGDPATLTCHFPEDLSQSRKDIAVFRRDSIPGSQYERLVGCTWNKEKLLCGVREEIKLITRQPMYDVTFWIESHQPGTFLCLITPEDEAVTVQSCKFTSKGPYRDTTDWSQRRNEDGATRTFCRVPPVFLGDLAALTCHFPEDLSQIRKGIAVFRRDSIPESQYERVVGCVWGKEKLACGIHEEIKLITRQPMYDVTFQIASHQPGTFRCHITPEDGAVTVQSCNLTLKGSDPSRDTTERSQRQNEDGDPLDVTTIVCIVMVPTFIAAVVMTLLVQRFCCRRPSGSTLVEDPKHGVVQTVSQVLEKESQPSGSTLMEDPKHGVVQTVSQVVEEESQSCGSASPLVEKHGKGESQTELAMKEIQPAGNVLVGEPKSTKGKAKCK